MPSSLSRSSVEEELRRETLRWLDRLEERLKDVEHANEKGREFLTNIRAYVSDSKYFLSKDDLVRAFECVVWAWAWLEIGMDLGIIQSRSRANRYPHE